MEEAEAPAVFHVETEDQLRRAIAPPFERILFWGSGSPQAWRVLIALEEKKLPYRSVCVSFSSGVLKTAFFHAINPRMRIPVLLDRPRTGSIGCTCAADAAPVVLYESSAILEYLERQYPTPLCMPSDLSLFGTAQTRLHEANEILSVVGELVLYLRRLPADKRNPNVVAAKWAALETELALWEAYLHDHHFLIDNATPYLCDFTLFTNLAYAVRCGLQLDGLYPRLAMFYVQLCARRSIDTTWPPHWRTTLGSKVLSKCRNCAVQACCSCSPPLTAMTTTPSDVPPPLSDSQAMETETGEKEEN